MSFQPPYDEELATAIAELTVEQYKDAIAKVAATQVALVQLRRQRVAAFLKRWDDATLIPNRKESANAAMASRSKSVSSFVKSIAAECHLEEGAASRLQDRVFAVVASAVGSQVAKSLATSN